MLVVLTGAGISQESGIDTFRDKGGLWDRVNIDDVATPKAFKKNPSLVYSFYNERRRQLLNKGIEPNRAHKALALLEKELYPDMLLITQNIDNLHEKAGSRNILHMHGELLKARCRSCHAVFPWEQDMDHQDPCPFCGPLDKASPNKRGRIRPHIVWFKEMPFYMDEIEEALSRCKSFVSIGTSGNVYPAAGFASRAKMSGAELVEINMEPSLNHHQFHKGYYGKATKEVPLWVKDYLAREFG